MYIVYFVFMDLYISGFLSNIASNSFYESKGNEENTFKSSNPQLSSSASFLRLNVLSSLN